MPEGRSLSAENPAAPKGPAKPAEPARPRASASAGPSPPLTLQAAAPVAPAAKPVAAPEAAPAAARPVAAPAPSAPQPAPVAPKKEAPAGEPEVTLPEPMQQAAVMYANGQSEAAVKTLTAAIAAGTLGEFASQSWLMLFDLYQMLGRKEKHDELALEFVVKFERSAPAWRDEPKEQAQDAAGQRGMGSYFAFTGILSNASAVEFEQLQKVAGKGALLRLDFSKLKDVDADGAKMLVEVLKAFVKAHRELVLSNHKNLVDLLSSHMEVGNKDNPQVFWMLLLDLYQILGLETEFEDTALNFAITYELSPPSFEVPAKPATAEAPSAPVADLGDDVIELSGELCGSDDEELARLVKSAALHQQIVIDMSKVRRVDVIAAGAILNTFTALAGARKSIEIHAASELVAALFQVVGITRHAKLIRRR